MVITTIIFDLGNVVLTNDWHHKYVEMYREFSDYYNITYDDLERAFYTFWPQFKTGKITEEEFWTKFLKETGTKNINIKQAKKLWRKYQKPIENMLSLLKKLKKHYRLAALTNISKEWLNYKRKKYNLDSYFDMIVDSANSGIAKPDPKIYKLFIKKANVDPKECLFIDDKQEILEPAKDLGMKTVLFTGQTELEKELRELGLEFS